jgi:hypothetical protein
MATAIRIAPAIAAVLQLAFREIRLYGAENFQIARRLRATIDNLMKTLPESRRPALRLELDLLDRTIEKLYIFPEDIALARISDTQGLGGSSGTTQANRPRFGDNIKQPVAQL